MSKTIWEFERWSLTAFIGPEGQRKGLQLTSPGEFILLPEKEAFSLAIAVLARLLGVEGWRATD